MKYVLFITSLVGSILLSACVRDSNSQLSGPIAQGPTTSINSEDRAWIVHQNEKFGIRFEYPQDIEFDNGAESDNGWYRVGGNFLNEGDNYINVTVFDKDEGLMQLASLAYRESNLFAPSVLSFRNGQFIVADGYGTGNYYFVDAYYEGRNYVYHFMMSRPDYSEEMLALFEEILASAELSQKTDDEISYGVLLNKALESGQEIVEIDDPGLEVPLNISKHQIQKTFRLGELRLALVLVSSMNIPIEYDPNLPGPTEFAGILIAKEGSPKWSSYLKIRDLDPEHSTRNNPYYLWSKDGKLLLSVVDQNGAGSSEGFMKIMSYPHDGKWKLEDCYYYVHMDYDESTGATRETDFLKFSSDLAIQKKLDLSECLNSIAIEVLN